MGPAGPGVRAAGAAGAGRVARPWPACRAGPPARRPARRPGGRGGRLRRHGGGARLPARGRALAGLPRLHQLPAELRPRRRPRRPRRGAGRAGRDAGAGDGRAPGGGVRPCRPLRAGLLGDVLERPGVARLTRARPGAWSVWLDGLGDRMEGGSTVELAEARALVKDKTEKDITVRHLISVEGVMRALARRFGQDEERWALAGLFHDLDQDQTGEDLARHAFLAAGWLRAAAVDEVV